MKSKEIESGRAIVLSFEPKDMEATQGELRDALKIWAEKTPRLILDFTDIEGLNSLFLGCLIGTQKRMTHFWKEKGMLILSHISKKDYILLDKTRLTDLFTISKTLEDACQHIPKYKIAIIDRDDDMYDFLSTVLRVNFYECQRIHVEHDLSENLKKLKPDLILSELDLGGFQGSDLIKLVETSECLCNCKLLFETAMHHSDFPDQVINFPHLTKPFKPDELLKAIDKILTHSE